jgi:hypothetical protein
METLIDFKLFLLRLFQPLLTAELNLICEHTELVFDEINDVYCKHCGKDFTG